MAKRAEWGKSNLDEGVLESLREELSAIEEERLTTASWTKPLEDICDIIQRERASLESVLEFKLSNEPHRLQLLSHGKGLSFLAFLSEGVKLHAETPARVLLNIARQQELLERQVSDVEQDGEALPAPLGRTLRRNRMERQWVDALVRLYVNQNQELPKAITTLETAITSYNLYLKERFVKFDRPEVNDQQRFLMLLQNPQAHVPEDYVKIKLIERNPLLTDVLLSLYESLPDPDDKVVKGRRKKEILPSTVSSLAVKLDTLGDETLLCYLKNPEALFYKISNAIKTVYRTLEEMDSPLQELLTNLVITPGNLQEVQEFSTQERAKMKFHLALLGQSSIDPIAQQEEDVLPDNRRERDYFALRDKAIPLIYETITELAPLPPDDYERRIELAKKAAAQLIELKGQADELLASYQERKLRKDKRADNEFYVGRQGEIGRFYFQREAAPSVKMDDVRGASFDQAKKHLDEIINTGEFPHLLRLSAPGGKVKSNILLIGPYGCGKTELSRAVCADPRVIGASVSVASTLTAYMHESVNNVKRVYDAAKELRMNSRELKPVALILDEFDGWFARSEVANRSDVDMHQIENVLLEVLDGMEDYSGIITLAMTNKPKEIPHGIIRRFRYVDIVGELTKEERANMLKMYLEKTLPVHPDVANHYERWAEKLTDAPGDVVRKVVDEIHFSLLPDYIHNHPKEAAHIERILRQREMEKGALDDKDIYYIKERLAKYRTVLLEDVDRSVDALLQKPNIRMQIDTARKVYRDAKILLEELSAGQRGFGLSRKSDLY